MASVFEWSEKYSVSIREMDAQHMKLIGLVRRLNDAMRKGEGRDALGGILKELITYTMSHFATEERLMQKHGYPEYEQHKSKHEKMTQKVLDLQRQYEAGRATLSVEVMRFLEDWVDKHILGTDMKYGPFLNGKGVH